ncbi:hypothetical protein Tsubulata_043559 [Turnera subulata]|uniref:Uncharacterized protein n=1 Tax=Turnera subulata TaxID=218843 RepID=A0A9Q0GEK6_9ROSI|nr:hypothetical protein Tsubulata_043559 [Turnera subulata]
MFQLDFKVYFKSALDRFQELNLMQELGQAGIRPNSTHTVKLSAVRNALSSSGLNPVIRCNTDRNLNALQLFEIFLCVQADGKSFVPCGANVRSSCEVGGVVDPDIYFPAN